MFEHHETATSSDSDPVSFRTVKPSEYLQLRELAAECPPLGVHTEWLYWIFATYQTPLCHIAEHRRNLVGMVLATATCDKQTAWLQQVGVVGSFRSQRLSSGLTVAQSLLDNLGSAATGAGTEAVEFSIAGENETSYGLFTSWAKRHDLHMQSLSANGVPEGEVRYRITLS